MEHLWTLLDHFVCHFTIHYFRLIRIAIWWFCIVVRACWRVFTDDVFFQFECLSCHLSLHFHLAVHSYCWSSSVWCRAYSTAGVVRFFIGWLCVGALFFRFSDLQVVSLGNVVSFIVVIQFLLFLIILLIFITLLNFDEFATCCRLCFWNILFVLHRWGHTVLNFQDCRRLE